MEAALDTESLLRLFLDRTLPKAAWTHVAHLRVGLWHVRRFGADQAIELLRERITGYNEAVGTANTSSSGYHETLTVFYVKVIDSRGCLFSTEARRHWVAPDLQPLP